MPGKLFLIPNIIHPDTERDVIAPAIFTVIKNVEYFLVENERTARRYLSNLMKLLPIADRKSIEQLEFVRLDKRSDDVDVRNLLESVSEGRDCGIISESGCPGIADPGSLAVQIAHDLNIEVIPLPGPSSIFLALMASGMNGQSFTFNGYLPIDKKDLETKIKQLEIDSRKKQSTQIFIETPYRNQRIFNALLNSCSDHTSLCVASDITGPKGYIKTMTIKEWKSQVIDFEKVPVVFLLYVK